MKLTIDVNQQLDECGGEFLDERNFEISFNIKPDTKEIECIIDGKENCFVLRSDLIAVLKLLEI